MCTPQTLVEVFPIGRIVRLCLLVLLALPPAMSGLSTEAVADDDVPLERPTGRPDGRVRFLNVANTTFDPWSYDPTRAERKWMRLHYRRMLVFGAYFDQRIDWFPNAWVYHNSYGIKYRSSRVYRHRDWILRDSDGRLLYLQYACNGRYCARYAGDPGNPRFRADWIARTRWRLAPGYRGVWVDDMNLEWRISDASGRRVKPIDPRTGETMRLADWRRYMADFAEEIRAAFPDHEIAHNTLWFAGPNAFDDESIERQLRAADYINLERGVNDAGLNGGNGRFSMRRYLDYVDYLHDIHRGVVITDGGNTPQARTYGLAGWLLNSTQYDFYSNVTREWSVPDSWWPGYALNLGHALGERYEWRKVLRRDFECGSVVLNWPDARTRSLFFNDDYRTIDGDDIDFVELPERSAEILLKDCACFGTHCTAHNRDLW